MFTVSYRTIPHRRPCKLVARNLIAMRVITLADQLGFALFLNIWHPRISSSTLPYLPRDEASQSRLLPLEPLAGLSEQALLYSLSPPGLRALLLSLLSIFWIASIAITYSPSSSPPHPPSYPPSERIANWAVPYRNVLIIAVVVAPDRFNRLHWRSAHTPWSTSRTWV